MNPFYSAILGSLFRALLTLLVPLIVSTGLWTPDEATQWVAATAAVLAALTLSIYQKHANRAQLLTALAARNPMTENEVKAAVAVGQAPSVLTPPDAVPRAKL